jgi:MoaA/NifB/PqqE/SkfB family radical SAM enzyme
MAGTLLKRTIKNFLDTKIDNVTISIDGHNAEVHDRLRGKKGSFQRAIEAIKLLTQQSNSKTKVYINSVLSYDNIEYFPELIETAKQSGAHGISFIPLHSIGDSKTTSPNYTNDERETVLKSVEQLCGAKAKDPYIESSLEYLRLFKNFFLGEPLPISCFAGYTTLLVDCYGDIYPCFTFYETNRSFANVRDYGGLKEYWYSKNLKRSRNEIRGCRECYWDCQVETNLLYKHLGSARRS